MEIQIFATGSTGNCYKVSDGSSSLLLDAGIPFKEIQRKCRFMVSGLNGCLVTHRHGDHSKSIGKLLERGIPVYGNKDLLDFNSGITYQKILQWFKVGTFNILPFDVKHDVECYGFYIKSTVTNETLLYITDAAYCKYTFQDINYLLIEANYTYKQIFNAVESNETSGYLAGRIIQTHMCIETLLGFLKSNNLSKLKKIFLLHLSNEHSDENDFKSKVESITNAEVYVA